MEKIELFCSKCGSTKKMPVCCTKNMELDLHTFFCEICGKEEKKPSCCGSYMEIRKNKTRGE